MLTNHEMDSSTPFATILVGQPTLRHNIKLGVLAALDQRITVRYQMKGMTPDETAGYIRHHLEEAGRTADLFTDDAVAQIHTAAAASREPSTTSASPHSSPPPSPARTSSTTPPPGPPSPRSPRQTDHPADTLNTQPCPAPPGRAFQHAHTLKPDDASMLTLNDAQQALAGPAPSGSTGKVSHLHTDHSASRRKRNGGQIQIQSCPVADMPVVGTPNVRGPSLEGSSARVD